MLCKKVSAKKKIKDEALAKKPVESGRAQEQPCKVRKKGVAAEIGKYQRKVEYEFEYGRKLGSWRSVGRGIY